MFSLINRTYPILAIFILGFFLYSHVSGNKISISDYVRTPKSTSLSRMSETEITPPLEQQKKALDIVYDKYSQVVPDTVSAFPPVEQEAKLELISPVDGSQYEFPHNEVSVKWTGESSKILLLIVRDSLSDKVIEKREVTGNEFRTRLPYPSRFEIALLKGNLSAKVKISYRAPVAQFDSRIPFIMADVKGEKHFKVQYKVNFPLKGGVLKAYRDQELKILIGEYPLNGKGQTFRAKRQGQYCFKVQSLMKNPYVIDTNPLCFSLNWDSRPVQETAIAQVEKPKVKKEKVRVAKVPKPSSIARSIASVPAAKSSPVIAVQNLDQIMTYYRIEGKDTYQFKLPPTKDAQMYHVQIFRDPEGHDLYKEINVQGRRVNWRTDLDGKMYYRYRVKNKDGNYGEFSRLGILKFPISPYDI